MKKILIIVLVIVLGFVAYTYLIKPQREKATIQEVSINTPTENTVNTTDTPNTETLDTTSSNTNTQNKTPNQNTDVSVNSSSITQTEKEAVISAYFAFGKILTGVIKTKDSSQFLAYAKKSHPEMINEFNTSPDWKGDLSEVAGLIYVFGGFEDITDKDVRASTTVWKKDGNKIDAKVFTKTNQTEVSYNLHFINQNGVWYVDIEG